MGESLFEAHAAHVINVLFLRLKRLLYLFCQCFSDAIGLFIWIQECKIILNLLVLTLFDFVLYEDFDDDDG